MSESRVDIVEGGNVTAPTIQTSLEEVLKTGLYTDGVMDVFLDKPGGRERFRFERIEMLDQDGVLRFAPSMLATLTFWRDGAWRPAYQKELDHYLRCKATATFLRNDERGLMLASVSVFGWQYPISFVLYTPRIRGEDGVMLYELS